jgi:hypothetical protein
MDQIKSVLRNYLACGSIKGTARQLKMSKNTVREYLRRAQAHCSELSELLDLEDENSIRSFILLKLNKLPIAQKCLMSKWITGSKNLGESASPGSCCGKNTAAIILMDMAIVNFVTGCAELSSVKT